MQALNTSSFVLMEKTGQPGVYEKVQLSNLLSTAKDRANHTGTQTASTISDFDVEVSNNTDVSSNTSKRSYPLADETKLSNIEANAEVQDLTIRTQETTNFTTASSISNSYTECNNATSLQVTITDAACSVGKILAFNQTGAGTVTYVGDTGVTLVDNGVSSLASTIQGGTDIFLKVSN